MSAQDDEVTIDPEQTRAAPTAGASDLGLTSAITAGPADRLRQGSGGHEGGHNDRSFAPGAIIASRYRLVALLGRGGMGEVYRADDLTLDQPVALKFLPAAVADGDTRLGQFHNELRVARQVSHKNVCRLYDLGEANGRRFLTMEYVDGEDLGSLLRRIGRIPHDKPVQIARQLCAGVAAAHDCGVLHRDLKPANVMIDGDGNVRITDFGIATAAGETANEFAGTLQYMAPEQFAGKGASIKTDIYALGLTLYEVFTGRRAQESKTLDDLRTFHRTGAHTTPSSIVRDLDPAVERLILRCLDRDPDRRPASALVVGSGPVTLLFPLLCGVLVTLVTVRYGLLSLVVARAVWDLIYTVPMMPVMSHWSAAAGNWTIALLMVLTLWAFYASRAGQPLFGSLLRD